MSAADAETVDLPSLGATAEGPASGATADAPAAIAREDTSRQSLSRVPAVLPSGRTPPPSAQSLPPGARIEALYAPRGEDGAALPPIETLLRWLRREIAASSDPRETAELRVRAALLCWDGRGNADAALDLLGDLDHPVATALRLHAAIDAHDSGALLRFADEVQHRGDPQDLAEVGELLLWRGEYARAAALLERATFDGDGQEADAARARGLRALALVLSGRVADAVEVLSLSSDPQAVLQAAQLCEDLLHDGERARTLLRRVLDSAKQSGAPSLDSAQHRGAPSLDSAQHRGAQHGLPLREQARAVERLFDLEARRSIEAGRTELLRRKLELLGGIRGLVSALEDPEPGHIEVFATAQTLAESLERGNTPQALSEAVSLLAAVARYCQDQRDGAAHLALHTALRTRVRVESARQAFGEAATTLEELSLRSEALATRPQRRGGAIEDGAVLSPQLLAWAQAYGRRAAELWESRVPEGLGRARAAYERLFVQDPRDGGLALALARLLLRQGAAGEAAAVLNRHAEAVSDTAPAELVRAARAAEAVRDSVVAERWLDATPAERPALEALARLHRRRGDRPRLCLSYRRLADKTAGAATGPSSNSPDDRRHAVYQAAAAALALEALPAREASQVLEDAGPDGPGRILVPFSRVLFLQRQGRYAEAADAIHAVLPRLRSPETQADLHLWLARAAAEHLGDADLSQRSYRRVLELRPGDVVALHALARFTAESSVVTAAALLKDAVAHALRGAPAAVTSPLSATLPDASEVGHASSASHAPPVSAAQRAAAVLLCELGDLYARPGPDRDIEQAVTYYEDASRLDPQSRPALRALSSLYQSAHRPAEELATLGRLLPLCADDLARLPLLLRVGACAEALAGIDERRSASLHATDASSASSQGGALLAFAATTAERALGAYAEALRIDPQNETALSHLTRLCRRLGRWDLVLSALAAVPHGLRVLRALAEAAERLERWADVARFKEEELGLLVEPREVLRAARALAELYEQRLQDPESAARVWERAYQASPEESLSMASVPTALARLYTAQGRHRELLALLEQELAHIDGQLSTLPEPRPLGGQSGRNFSGPVGGADNRARRDLSERRRELLLRQAQLLQDPLRDSAAAATRYEQVLADFPDDPQALSALSALYAAEGRQGDLRAVLSQRARGTSDPVEQSKILVQLGELLERGAADELPEAQSIYQKAFDLDPSNRGAFTALERVCYRREDWSEALRMYDAALRLVEQQRSRAYRLGDLYARRGQVLLQYLNRPADAAACYLKALEHDADNDANQAALERIYAQAAAERSVAAGASPPERTTADRITLIQPAIQADGPGNKDTKGTKDSRDSRDGRENKDRNTGPQVALGGAAAAAEWSALITAYERRAALVRDDGKRVEILRRAARVAAAKLRDIPEAIRLYQKLHAVDPTDGEALDALERHYERSRDHERLIALLGTRLALSTTESESIALNLRIATLCEEGLRDHGRAIDAYRQVLDLSPNHREALDAMGRLFEATERWAELIEVTRRQIRQTTDRTQKALLYFKCGSVMEAKFSKEDDAIRYYEAAVKTSPSCLPAVHGLRDIYLRRTDWPKVTQTLELEAKLWTEDKERAGIYAHIGQIYRDELRDLDRAIQYYESALAVDRECLPANRALFEVYYERGDYARAVPISQVLSAKVNREGEPAERSAFYLKRAIVAARTGGLTTAAESLVVALEIQPENLDALEHLLALCRRDSAVYDFGSTFRELEKLYRRRAAGGPGTSRSTQSLMAMDVGALLRGGDTAQRGLALSLVGRAVLAERAFDIDTAESLLTEAMRLLPLDFAVIEALVGLHERLRHFGEARDALQSYLGRLGMLPRGERPLRLRAEAQLRLAEMYSEAALQHEDAVAVLRALAAELGGAAQQGEAIPQDLWRRARFALAQELYLLGRYPEARGTIDGLIEDAARPPQPGSASGSQAPPEELARYYDYLGRIQEAMGEGPAAQRSYRRAVDLDQAFALPALALARRAVGAGDRPQAETLIREALGQAARRGDPREELLLLRGVARILAPVDTAGAVAAYRRAIQQTTAQLAEEARLQATLGATTAEAAEALETGGAPVVARETMDDRVALADLLLQQGAAESVTAARDELQRVLQRDLRHAPAYRLLAEAYDRLGERERAGRVLSALALLGYADPVGPGAPPSFHRPNPRRGTITDEVHRAKVALPALASPYMDLVQAIGDQLSQAFPPPWPLVGSAERSGAPFIDRADDSTPLNRVADAGTKLLLSEAQRLHNCPDVEFLVAPQVPGSVLTLESYRGRPTVILEAGLLERADSERRFLLGRALEPLRGGYAVLLRLRAAEQREVERLLTNLLRPESERDATAHDFVRNLPRKSYRVVEKLTGTVPRLTAAAFFSALPLCADRAGLLSCDDVTAAARMMARLQGEELALVDSLFGGAVLLGQVQGGTDLVRYFLSDAYHEVRGTLRDASPL